MATMTASRPTITVPHWTPPQRTLEGPAEGREDATAAKLPGPPSQSASRQEAPETAPARGRRDRPCDACRRRKTRCAMEDGGQICSLCRMQGQTCTFVENPLPRKRRSISDAPEQEEVKRRTSVASNKHPPAPAPAPGPSSQASSRRVADEEPGKTPAEPALVPQPASAHMQRRVRYVGLTTEVESCLSDLCHLPDRPDDHLNRGALQKFGGADSFLVSSAHASRSGDAHDRYIGAIEAAVAASGPKLVELYFAHVHPAFPVLDKQDFLTEYRRSPSRIAPPLLAAVYLLARRWCPRDMQWPSGPDGDVLSGLALGSLEIALRQPAVSTVQAGLLLLQQPDDGSWLLTTQLVAVGQDLGLHLDCSEWGLAGWERGLRKRVAWALFMQDKWSALVHGRPPHILSSNWAVRPLVDDDFEGSGPAAEGGEGTFRGEATKLLFSGMVTLTVILSEILETFYALQTLREIDRAGTDGTRAVLERAKPIQIKLRDWYTSLPGCIRMDQTKAAKLPSIGSLHLAYFATEITLHRRIVRSLNASTTDPYLLHICRTAAKTRLISAMDFVNRLKVEHLQSFWYSASKMNFALVATFGGLLWATSLSQQEAEFYRLRLAEYRWTLTVSRKWARFIGFAVGTLDRSRRMLEHLEAKPSMPGPTPTVDVVRQKGDTSTGAPSLSQWSGPDSSGNHPGSLLSSMDGSLGMPSPSSSTGCSEASGSVVASMTPATGSRDTPSPARSTSDENDRMKD